MPAKSLPIARRWITPGEAAEHLGVTDRTIRNYVAAGRLTGYRLGKRAVRLDLDEVDALLRPIPAASGGQVA